MWFIYIIKTANGNQREKKDWSFKYYMSDTLLNKHRDHKRQYW